MEVIECEARREITSLYNRYYLLQELDVVFQARLLVLGDEQAALEFLAKANGVRGQVLALARQFFFETPRLLLMFLFEQPARHTKKGKTQTVSETGAWLRPSED